jgi:saccharopine dehydrogenase-like NADP-dependent oxidoreductase
VKEKSTSGSNREAESTDAPAKGGLLRSQITTAAAICTVLDLLVTGQLPQRGFVRQEDIPLEVFLANRFGQVYAKPETSSPQQRFGGSGR